MSKITFKAHDVQLESFCGQSMLVTVEADLLAVVEDIPVSDRLHDVEASDIVEAKGADFLLQAMGEQHFDEWIKNQGDYYEALNAIGVERIQEWLESYTGGEQ